MDTNHHDVMEKRVAAAETIVVNDEATGTRIVQHPIQRVLSKRAAESVGYSQIVDVFFADGTIRSNTVRWWYDSNGNFLRIT